MFKNLAFYTFVLFLTIFAISLGYFIFVNTLLADNVLPNIKLDSRDVSMLSQSELQTKIESESISALPKFIKVNIDDYQYEVATSTLDLKLEDYNLMDYGKGRDFLKVISEALHIMTGTVNIELEFSADVNDILFNSPINFTSNTYSKLESNKFNCIKDKYKFDIDSEYILSQLNIGLVNAEISLNTSMFIKDKASLELYNACQKYFKESQLIQTTLSFFTNQPFNNFIDLYRENDLTLWKFVNSSKKNELLNSIKILNNVEAKEGVYEFYKDKIFLYEKYQIGYKVNIEETDKNLTRFLEDPSSIRFEVSKQEFIPSILVSDVEILDFTNEIGQGKSRIELVRNGQPNYIVAYTQYGLEEIDYHVLNPGEEFSYIDFIQPVNGRTKSGRPIAPGICNSTTTLFRAVLESGLAVTDRSYHAYYVPSYEWGYPYNIVDAAYFTNPDVDFKFKNDSQYPILLRVEFTKDTDYQYNTVKILTSSEAVNQEVELTDWKIWDKYSETNFKGSFDRVVKQNGVEIKRDYFYSHYL